MSNKNDAWSRAQVHRATRRLPDYKQLYQQLVDIYNVNDLPTDDMLPCGSASTHQAKHLKHRWNLGRQAGI